MSAQPQPSTFQLASAVVTHHQRICREHFRLTVTCANFAEAQPGQFVQLSPEITAPTWRDEAGDDGPNSDWPDQSMSLETTPLPLLPRAFSIGGLRRSGSDCEIDIIYRVVGVATQWMATLRPGHRVSLLGPLGQAFPIFTDKPKAFLVGGGVGVPPLLWLAEVLTKAGIETIACIGATTKDLLPLDHAGHPAPCANANEPRMTSTEFAQAQTPVVISTDDGSFGFSGNVVEAFKAHVIAHAIAPSQTIVYTCGPERMMQAAAQYCEASDLACYVCMERSMACGVGTCQSCVVSVKADSPTNWRYALCCTEGPVFESSRIIWD